MATNENYQALFYKNDGTIRDLHVDGKIDVGDSRYVGAIAAENVGTIRNCWVSADVASTHYNTSTDANLGGIAGSCVSVNDYYGKVQYCVMSGNVSNPKNYAVGGMVGYAICDLDHVTFYGTRTNSHKQDNLWVGDFRGRATLENKHSADDLANDADFASYLSTVSEEYSLYRYALQYPYAINVNNVGNGSVEVSIGGQSGITRWRPGATVTVTKKSGTLSSITATYNVSGITAYGKGIVCGSTFYYGNGDQVSLTLTNSAPSLSDGKSYGYTASAGTLSGTTLTMPDADVTIGLITIAADWATANQGTQNDPFLIYNKEQLDLLATRVNGGNSYTGKYFKLMNDIAYSYDCDLNDASNTTSNFTAIGGYTTSGTRTFNGDFDGDSHTISGIRLYKSYESYRGLFGFLGTGANVHDLTLADTRITGNQYTGGIAGYNAGTITRCRVEANVAIHDVMNSSVHGGIAGYNTGTLSYNLVNGATVTAVSDNSYGAICGNSKQGTLQNNYYIGCTVGGTANATNVGCENADVTANSGAVPAYRITEGDAYVNIESAEGPISANNGLTIYDTGFMLDDVLYAAIGETVHLTLTTGRSLFDATYRASAGTLSGTESSYTLTMPAADVTMPAADVNISVASWAPNALAKDGSGNYLINNENDWDMMGYYVASGLVAGFNGKTLKLNNDISVTTMVGTDGNHTFRGTFDGQGNTLTIDYTTSEDFCGPFRYTYGATIKNLKTSGTITTSSQHAGGVVGRNSTQNTTLRNVSSDVDIVSTYSYSSKGFHGGLMGYAINATFEGCAFTGTNTHHWGGLLGQKSIDAGYTATFTNCLFAPTALNINTGASYSFAYIPGDASSGLVTVTNSYYTDALLNAQGTKAYALATVPANLGAAGTAYDALTAYANGILFGGTYYVAPATISLANADDNSNVLTASAGQIADVTLDSRTLYKDGAWNTICLPFNVVLEGSPFENAEARPLTSASVSGSTLSLTFGDAVTELEAGTPYIIKWYADADYVDDDDHNIVNPVFSGVTIDATDRSYDNKANGDLRVRFLGTYKSMEFTDTDNSILFLGGTNTLYYPQPDLTANPAQYPTIGAQRAYFNLGDGNALACRLTAFNIDFGEGETQGISTTDFTDYTDSNDAWYDMQGRKLDGKPAKAGIYVNRGKKVVVK